MKRAILPLLLLTTAGYGDVLLKFNKGPESTASFTFEGEGIGLHPEYPYIHNDGNGNDGEGSGAVNIHLASASKGTAILSNGYTITKTDVGKPLSATVWHYRSGPNSYANVALALLLDGKVVGTESASLAFSREAADPKAEPTKDVTGEYVIMAEDVGKKLSLRFRSVSTSTQEKGVSYAIDAVTFSGVGATQ